MIPLPIFGDMLCINGNIFRMTAKLSPGTSLIFMNPFSLNCFLKLKLLKPVMLPGNVLLLTSSYSYLLLYLILPLVLFLHLGCFATSSVTC